MTTEKLWTGFDNTKIMAERAVCDEVGQNIADTYVAKADVPSVYDAKLKLQLGNDQAADTGFTANASADATLTVPEMGAAGASAAGTAGLVPAPDAGDQGKFLTGAGTWDALPVLSSTTTGIVNAPASANRNHYSFLDGMGDWSMLEEVTDNDIDSLFLRVTVGGHEYRTVIIGNQEWMAQNLDYKFAYDGGTLPIGPSGDPSTPAAWYYSNSEATYGIDGTYRCGLLYNWYAAKYLDDNKATLLPAGWHVPTKTEIETMLTEVGGWSTAGTRLKALDNSITSAWPSGFNGTDDYGFAMLPTGSVIDGSFEDVNTIGRLWSTSEFDTSAAYGSGVYKSTNDFATTSFSKTFGFSIRLVKTLS